MERKKRQGNIDTFFTRAPKVQRSELVTQLVSDPSAPATSMTETFTTTTCAEGRQETEDCSHTSTSNQSNFEYVRNSPNDISSSTTTNINCTGNDLNLDVGKYLNCQNVNDELKFNLLTNHWKPKSNFDFPYSEHVKQGKVEKRYLRMSHLEQCDWLVYSNDKKGLLCKYCVLFSNKYGGYNANVELNKLVTTPVTDFAKILGKDGILSVHGRRHYHLFCEEAAKGFLHTYMNPTESIPNQLDTKRLLDATRNRERLVPIVKTTIFLARQNIPLRGHRDDGSFAEFSDEHNNTDSLVANEGNFRESLRFRIDAGDTVLEQHLRTANSNATYISKTTQNEIINCCGEVISSVILKNVREAKFYGIQFDETTDISHKQQMTLILTYIKKNVKHDDFLCFVDTHKIMYGNMFDLSVEPKISGIKLGQLVVKTLQDFGLDLNLLVSISTDTCSMMSSEQVGAVSEIQKVAKNATWNPCISHSLNLSLSKTSQVPEIRNCCATISDIITFFHMSAKRNFLLKSLLGFDLISLCATRFIERHLPIEQFVQNLSKILEALHAISSWTDVTSSQKAESLISAVNAQFIISLHSLNSIFLLSHPLTRSLQKVNIDIVLCDTLIKDFIDELNEKRMNCVEKFHALFENASDIMSNENIHMSVKRQAKTQTCRNNVPHSTPEQYYLRAVYIPLIDNVLVDLKSRLNKSNLVILSLSFLMPCNIIQLTVDELQNQVTEHCPKFSSVITGLAFEKAKEKIESEKKMWARFCKELPKKDLSPNAQDTLSKCDKEIFPIVYSYLNILCVASVSVASAERSFSVLRRLKSWIRSRMSEERLNGLALLAIHREIEVNVNDVINLFARKSRKLNFVI
jgi:hypothetical protein